MPSHLHPRKGFGYDDFYSKSNTCTTTNVQRLTIFGDNQPTIALMVNFDHHFCMKHIDILYHFVHEQIQKGIIAIEYISTKEMHVNGLTKPLTHLTFNRFFNLLGLEYLLGSSQY